MCSHSNDGDGDVAGTLRDVPAKAHPIDSVRHVSGGTIPQVPRTYQYKTEGYSIMNEFQVGLCESTCNAVFDAEKGWGAHGILNIVDLSQLAMERSICAKDAVQVMGSLAVKHGYRDAGESMLVVDPNDAWIFHVLPDDTNTSAIWIAQRLQESEIASVANAFVIRDITFPLDGTLFLGSSNLKSVAINHGWWMPSETSFDFSELYSLGELGPKYNSGRRMWETYRLLAPNKIFASEYGNFRKDKPYPTTVHVPPQSISSKDLFQVMRSFYNGTKYDLTHGISSGPFGNPFRAAPGKGALSFPKGRWERPIATWKSQVSYIVSTIDSVIWFAPHAAHTAVYMPFIVTMPITSAVSGPVSIDTVNRSTAFWANRYVFHLSQLNFLRAYQDIVTQRTLLEDRSVELLRNISTVKDKDIVARTLNNNANDIVAQWSAFSDSILITFAEGNCNGCAEDTPRHLGYPKWWLESVGFDHPNPFKLHLPLNGTPPPTLKKKVVLVTGATGRTGSALYKQLQSFHSVLSVRGLVRNTTKAREVLGCQLCDRSEGIFVGDVTKASTLGSAFANVDTVVILTGSFPIQLKNGTFIYEKGATPRDVDYLGSNNQVLASLSAKTVQQIILVSSMGTTHPGSFLDLLGNGFGLSYKLNAEMYLMQTSIASNIDFTIVKPSGLLPTTEQGPTNATYLIGHSDCLPECSKIGSCMAIARNDLANVLTISVVNSSLFLNTRFDLSSDIKVPITKTRDWNMISKHIRNTTYPPRMGCDI
jgi:dipeptidase